MSFTITHEWCQNPGKVLHVLLPSTTVDEER